MNMTHPSPGMLRRSDVNVEEFRALIEADPPASYRFADRVEHRVPIFAASRLRDEVATLGDDWEVRSELATILDSGPGIYVIAGAFDGAVIDRATEIFNQMIARQHEQGIAIGDHYAKPGANDRVWNAIEKLAYDAPDVFVEYFSNDMVALGSLAWLGPDYQISSQVNVVNPGGEAQQPHRDYHLGFMTDDRAEQYPAHAHRLSPMLTLQGAIAHCDMPVESGPTMYLPFSQRYELGYLAWRNEAIKDYFAQHYTQLPLHKGDLVFFNPALLHAAGSNVTADVKRMANLVQISSAMGRAMENMNRLAMTAAVYPSLLAAQTAGMEPALVHNAAVAAADGYAFPTNLDNDPPLDGLTPRSNLDLLETALANGDPPEALNAELEALGHRRSLHWP